MKNQILVMMFLLVLGTSCKKDIYERYEATKAKADEKKAVNSIKELKAEDSFEWKTTRNVTMILKGESNSPVIVSNTSGQIIMKSMLKANEELKVTVTIPASESKITFNYMGRISTNDLVGNNISIKL